MTAHDAATAALTPGTAARGDAAARGHLVVAALFFVVGAAAYAAVSLKLVRPEFLDGSGYLSYGRLLPAAAHLLVYGWLTVALIGAAYYMVPRLTGAPLVLPWLAQANLVLLAFAAAAGTFRILIGQGDGDRFFAAPWCAEAILMGGVLAAAVLLTLTARAGTRDRLPVAAWYLVASPWWLLLTAAVAAVPGVDGLPAALRSWFSVSALTGLWLAAAGVGVAYFLVGRLVEGATFHPHLGRIGFWSLAFAWPWTAGRYLQYGPTPDWMETVPVLFTAGLVVATVAIVADFGHALRGRWSGVRGSVPLWWVLAGTVLFVAMALQMFLQTLRGPSAVVHFTAWEEAFRLLTLFGPFTLWALGAVYLILPALRGRHWRGGAAAPHLVLGLAGLAAALISRWIAGLQQGYTWVGAVVTGDFANTGDGFRNSVVPLEAMHWVQVIGLCLALAGVVVFAAGALRYAIGRMSAERDSAAPAGSATAPLRLVLVGAAALFGLALVAVLVLPAVDADADPSPLAAGTRSHPDGSLEAAGRALYASEGCVYCHTQQVRAVVTDVGLGMVSVPGDYAYDEAVVPGLERVGPDLAHAGSRAPTDDAAWLRIHLTNPRVLRPWSIMPGYDYLSDDDLAALVAYLAALE